MSFFERQSLIMFLGVPGSGKSYFARQAAENMNAVRLNGDSMRLAIFGSRERIKQAYESKDRQTVNTYVFNAIDYATDQVLLRGHDVVYDAHHNKRSDRASLETLASKYGALPVLVWVKTPHDIALIRGQEREEQQDQRKKTEAEMHEVIERHLANTDEPDPSELVITLDGLLPFDKQFLEFQSQMEKIIASEQVSRA